MVGLIETVDIVRFTATSGILILASISDIRTRRVSDAHWMAICAATIPLSTISMCLIDTMSAICYLIGSGILTAYMLSPKITGFTGTVFVTVAATILSTPLLLGLLGGGVPFATILFSILFLSLYRLRILPGGADVKCLMTLAIASPLPVTFHVFPILGDVPLYPGIALPAFVIGLIISIFYTICSVSRRKPKGTLLKQPFTSYETSVDNIRIDFEWPVLQSNDRNRYRKDPETMMGIIDELKKRGVERISVTPTVPLIATLTCGYIFVSLLGNPITFILRC